MIQIAGFAVDACFLIENAGIDGIPNGTVVGKGDLVAVFVVCGIDRRNVDIGHVAGFRIDIVKQIGHIPVFIVFGSAEDQAVTDAAQGMEFLPSGDIVVGEAAFKQNLGAVDIGRLFLDGFLFFAGGHDGTAKEQCRTEQSSG